MKGPGGTTRQRIATYQRTSSVPSSTARSSPESSTGDREGLFARIDQLEMTVSNLAAENDALEKKIRGPQMERLAMNDKAQASSVPESNTHSTSHKQNDDTSQGIGNEQVNEAPIRSMSETVDAAVAAVASNNGTLVQTINSLQNKVLALEAELSQEKQSKVHTPMRRLPTPQMSGSTLRVGSPPRQKGVSSPRGCSHSTPKVVRSPSSGRNSPSPSRTSSKGSLSIARSKSEEALLGWYRQQKPGQQKPGNPPFRFSSAKVAAERVAVEKNRRLRPPATNNCPGYQRPTTASNAGRPVSSTRPSGHQNRSAATPQRRRSKSPPKRDEVEDPVPVGLFWESLNSGLALTMPEKGHWICGDHCMRGEHFEPYRPIVPVTTGNFLFKAAPPFETWSPGAPTGIAKERTGTCTPPWARASAQQTRGRLASGDISVSDATTPRVSVVELTAQIASQLRDRYGALEIAATHAAVNLGLCDSRQINDYISARVSNGLHLQNDPQLQMGSRPATLAESPCLSELHKALPPIRFTVEEFEESLIDVFKLVASRKDIRRIFHIVDKCHGRIGLIELPHLAEDYQYVVDELEASLNRSRSQSTEQRTCSVGMRTCSPENEEHNAITIEEARQRRRSPRSLIVPAQAPAMPASGVTLVEHANAVLLSTLRTEDLSERQSVRPRSHARSRANVSPRNAICSLPTPTSMTTFTTGEAALAVETVSEHSATMGLVVERNAVPLSGDSDETSEPVCVSRLASSSASRDDNELGRLTSAESAQTEHITDHPLDLSTVREQSTEQPTEEPTEQPASLMSESMATHAELVPEGPATVQTVHSIAEVAKIAQIIHANVATVRPPRPPLPALAPNEAAYEIRMPMKGEGGFSPPGVMPMKGDGGFSPPTPGPSGWSTPSQIPSLQGSQAMFATPGCTPQTGGATPASCVTPSPTPPMPAPPPPSGFPTVIPPVGVPASAVASAVPRLHAHGWDAIRNRLQHGGLIQIPSGMSPRVQGGPFPYPAMR